MTDDETRERNRDNAQKSTGPRTPEGKAASSGNAIRHGLTAARVVLASESQEAFDSFRGELESALAPVGAVEAFLAEIAVVAAWRLRRVLPAEKGHLDSLALDEAFNQEADAPSLDNLGRYETRLFRQLTGALR